MNKKTLKYRMLQLCLVFLILIIIGAVALIIFSNKNNDNNNSESSILSDIIDSDGDVSDESSSGIDFKPESSYELNLKIGEVCKAELTDFETTSKLIWLTSDADIASVDDEGNITAVSSGTCTVTVIIMDTDDSIAVKVNVE